MSEQSPSAALVGAVLNGRFRLVRLLGEGGMGAVYEANGLRGEGTVAIKALHPEFVDRPQVVERFFAEAAASRALEHPNIVRVFEAARAEDGTPYLVMELLRGVPVVAYLNPGQTIPSDHAARIVHGVLQALSVAHARGVIHRDLKPDNLHLVPDATGTMQVKVLDFGIAKVMDLAGGMGSKTKTGALLGTPGYMSPEQVKSAKAADARSDLFSVGVVLYEMLTGTLPFPAPNEFARMTAVLTQDPVPIEAVRPDLAGWSPFLRKALAREPEHRFQSADEMAAALGNVARGGSHTLAVDTTERDLSAAAAAAIAASRSGAPAASLPPSSLESHAPPAPVVSPAVRTHASAPTGAQASSWDPSIAVVTAPKRRVEVWVVVAVALVCLGLGFALGFGVARL